MASFVVRIDFVIFLRPVYMVKFVVKTVVAEIKFVVATVVAEIKFVVQRSSLFLRQLSPRSS